VSVERAFATSYWSLIVTLNVSPTVFETMTFKLENGLFFSVRFVFFVLVFLFFCLTTPLGGSPSQFSDETRSANTRGMGHAVW